MRALVIAAILSLAPIAMTATEASASACVGTPDGGGQVCWNSDINQFTLKDLKADSHSVYVDYEVNGGPNHRQEWSGGRGTQTSWNVPGDGGIRYRVCTDIQFGSDSCSTFINDTL